MKTPLRRSLAAFTLIEMMTVITIIIILAAIVIGSMGYAKDLQAKKKAQVQLNLLAKAIEDYKSDNGTYPPTNDTATPSGTPTTDTGNSDILFNALYFEGYDYEKKGFPANWVKTVGSNTAFPKATKIYITELDPTNNKQGWTVGTASATTRITDPWGFEYRYRTATDANGAANPSTQNPDFDLWSVGKDGKTNVDPKHKDCRDDLKNF